MISHDRPDGDAVGSAVGLGLILEAIGKEVRIVNRDPVPETLSLLGGSDRVEAPSEKIEADLVLVLDSAEESRIGDEVWAIVPGGVTRINIDHHISNPGFGDINLVDPAAPATGQIVFELAEFAGWPVEEDAASQLYAAISTDTGSFRYPATSATTLRIAAALVERGVDVGEINRVLYESFPRRRVEALRLLLQTLRFDADGACASVMLPRRVSEELGLRAGDTEGVIDTIRAIDSVVIAVFFEELEDGRIRVSSRSKTEEFGVGEICAEFGGGGHTLAAGARLPGPIEEARERFLGAVCDRLRRKAEDPRK